MKIEELVSRIWKGRTAKFRNDGFDLDRTLRAASKRKRRMIKRAYNAYNAQPVDRDARKHGTGPDGYFPR